MLVKQLQTTVTTLSIHTTRQGMHMFTPAWQYTEDQLMHWQYTKDQSIMGCRAHACRTSLGTEGTYLTAKASAGRAALQQGSSWYISPHRPWRLAINTDQTSNYSPRGPARLSVLVSAHTPAATRIPFSGARPQSQQIPTDTATGRDREPVTPAEPCLDSTCPRPLLPN